MAGELTGRVLPPEEWAAKTMGTPLEGRPLNPACSRVVVVEQDGQVVACVAVLTLVHAEELWEAPQVRGQVGVSRTLLETLVQLLQHEQVPEVLAQSLTDHTDHIFETAGGTPLPGTCYVIPVEPVQ